MKIAVSIPCHSVAPSWFVQSLAGLLTHSAERGLTLMTAVLQSSCLARTRNRLVRDAIGAGVDYMLWLDSDHVFPADTLLRLLDHGREMIGVTQPTRSLSPVPTAFHEDGSRVFTTPEQVAARAVERVRYIGLGVALMKMSVISKLQAKRKHLFPLFDTMMTPDPERIVGEDLFFCDRLHEAGIEIFVDHALSWEVQHLATLPVSMADALKQRRDD